MVVGQDVAVWADDHTTAKACLGLLLLVSEKKPEPRVTATWIAHSILAGIDADYRWRGLFCCTTKAACLLCTGRRGWRFDDGDGPYRAHPAAKPFRLERRGHEIGCHQHGDGLGKKEPESVHIYNTGLK